MHRQCNNQSHDEANVGGSSDGSNVTAAYDEPLHFCDDGAHNRYAPTKQNQMCDRRSVLEVILMHADFYRDTLTDLTKSSHPVDVAPRFTYKKHSTTRYVLILDETQDTMVRESWTFLKLAIRNWVVYDLPANTEVGVLLANDTGTSKQFDLSSLMNYENRNLIASFIPFSPSESQKPACMNCAVRDAQAMLEKQTNDYGAASSVILIIAPGMDAKTETKTLVSAARKEKVRIATINYPGVIVRKPLDTLAKETSGLSYTLYENKQNSERTYLTTYFSLVNILYNIMTEYYEGNRLNLPMEIHRKKLFEVSDDTTSGYSAKRSSRQITGTFLLDDNMGSPANFLIYTHSAEIPLINSVNLNSPSGYVYSKRSDERLSVKQMIIEAPINETGTWSYTIDRFNGNPQPHFVQVKATVRKSSTSAITIRAWIDENQKRTINSYGHNSGHPIIVYVEVKKGHLPVSEALVEMTVTRPETRCETANKCQQTIRILDTGSGDPDVTKGDGIYTRYFNPSTSGSGVYQFDIQVTDNGNTAYSLPDGYNADFNESIDAKCCGSFIPHPAKQPLPSFQRVLPTLTVFLNEQQVFTDIMDGLGRIGDVRVESVDTSKIQLSWTAPDIGGLAVARYEVKYAFTVEDIVDNFDSNALPWMHDIPLAFSIGDHTSFAMNISSEMDLIGKTIFIALRPYAQLSNNARPGPVSNFVRVHIEEIPPPTKATSPDDENAITDDQDGGYIAKNSSFNTSIEWVFLLIIICICAIILVCLISFCYFCVIKRRRKNEKSAKGSMCDSDRYAQSVKDDKSGLNMANNLIPSISTTDGIHRIPSPSPPKSISFQQSHYDQSAYIICPSAMANPHTIGLPLYHSDEEINKQQQYSAVQDLKNELLDKYKQRTDYQPYVMANEAHLQQGNTISRNGEILSPYESWTASQLLHEHERRHSSLDDIISPTDIDHDMHRNTDNISLIKSGYHKGERLSLAGVPASHMDGSMGLVNTIFNSTPINSPPVPPLPYTTSNSGYPINYQMYSSGGYCGSNQAPSISNYSTIIRNSDAMHGAKVGNGGAIANSSLQGSLCSVNSGNDTKKKTRTITMV